MSVPCQGDRKTNGWAGIRSQHGRLTPLKDNSSGNLRQKNVCFYPIRTQKEMLCLPLLVQPPLRCSWASGVLNATWTLGRGGSGFGLTWGRWVLKMDPWGASVPGWVCVGFIFKLSTSCLFAWGFFCFLLFLFFKVFAPFTIWKQPLFRWVESWVLWHLRGEGVVGRPGFERNQAKKLARFQFQLSLLMYKVGSVTLYRVVVKTKLN